MVVVGIDAHKRSHTAVAVDEYGRKLGQRTIGTTSEDHLALLGWAEQFEPGRSWAVEDCRHLSRRLEPDLLAAGERIVRVPTEADGARPRRGAQLRQIRSDRRSGGRPSRAAGARPTHCAARRPSPRCSTAQ